MTKVYLKAGQKITLNGGETKVGASSTTKDTYYDWGNAREYSGDLGVATYFGAGWTAYNAIYDEHLYFAVFVEEKTNRLWFDDETGV